MRVGWGPLEAAREDVCGAAGGEVQWAIVGAYKERGRQKGGKSRETNRESGTGSGDGVRSSGLVRSKVCSAGSCRVVVCQ